MSNDVTITVGAIGLFIWLLTKRWFWIVGSVLGLIASVFTTLACIIHFQILPAIGFFLLALFCLFMLGLVTE